MKFYVLSLFTEKFNISLIFIYIYIIYVYDIILYIYRESEIERLYRLYIHRLFEKFLKKVT